MKIIKKRNNKGFTLVEMMVAVSIFVIVAFIVVSTLLTMSYAYKKAQKMRLLMDNFNFALQAMSLNIREGVDYSVGNNDGSSWFKFKPIDSWMESSDSYACYSFVPGNKTEGIKGYVEKCDGPYVPCPCSGNGSKFTSSDIDVQNLMFEVNDGDVGVKLRNKVKIIISGEAGNVLREKTSFFIQNTVSQRNNNNL